MKSEPLKEWLFNPTCSNCMQNFHKTQKAVAWLKEKLCTSKKYCFTKRKVGFFKCSNCQKFDEAFAGVEGK